MAGIGGWHRRATRQHHANRFGNRRHGGRRAHRHAGAIGAGNACLHTQPILVRDGARAQLVPIFPAIRAGAERLAAPVAAQHRASRQEDRRNIHRRRAEQQTRRGLVATAHQHRTIHRMRAQQFLHFHRQHVAIEHGGRLEIALRQRQRRQFHRKAPGHQNAAFDVFHPLLEMHMAGLKVRPRIDDRNDRFAGPFLGRIAHLHGARAMAEAAQIGGAEPPRRAQILGRATRGLAGHESCFLDLDRISTSVAAR